MASQAAATRAQRRPGLPAYRKILVAVDGSEDSTRAGEHAACLSKSVGAELFVLGVVGIDPRLAARRGVCFVGVGPDRELERRLAVTCRTEREGVGRREGRQVQGAGASGTSLPGDRGKGGGEGSGGPRGRGPSRASGTNAAFPAEERFKRSLERARCPVLRVRGAGIPDCRSSC